MHILLTSDAKINYEIYPRFGGLPSADSWDYYANSTSNSSGSMFLALNDSSGTRIEFYILYPREGTWCIGLKYTPFLLMDALVIVIINGACHILIDESGLTFYSYCACDRDHGGFDCSNELVTQKGHMWQSISLVASNAAAILPSFWALRQKAYAEWILFSSSGISSGLYHACDVGTWCTLSFHVLQMAKIKSWFRNLMKKLQKRYHWRFVLLGFITLALAATSWKWRLMKVIGYGVAYGILPSTHLPSSCVQLVRRDAVSSKSLNISLRGRTHHQEHSRVNRKQKTR